MKRFAFRTILVFLSIIISTPALSKTIDVLIKGVDDGIKTSKQQDYKEAVMNAKLQAIERAGVEIESITRVVNFKLKYKMVESKAKAVLLPGFQIIDVGYLKDGTYQVVLAGKLRAGESEDNESVISELNYAKSLYNRGKYGDAEQKLQKLVDRYPTNMAAQEALFMLIDIKLRSSQLDEAIEKYWMLKSKSPQSHFVIKANKTIVNLILNIILYAEAWWSIGKRSESGWIDGPCSHSALQDFYYHVKDRYKKSFYETDRLFQKCEDEITSKANKHVKQLNSLGYKGFLKNESYIKRLLESRIRYENEIRMHSGKCEGDEAHITIKISTKAYVKEGIKLGEILSTSGKISQRDWKKLEQLKKKKEEELKEKEQVWQRERARREKERAENSRKEYHFREGYLYFKANRYDLAIHHFQIVRDIDPNYKRVHRYIERCKELKRLR